MPLKRLENHPMIHSGKPFTRWWWFAGPIALEDIDSQLDWLSDQGFGGVEIAWVYPYSGTPKGSGPEFLDREFIATVRYAVEGCKNRQLGCDVTFGTLWPFCGSFIDDSHASKTLFGLSEQSVVRSWETNHNAVPVHVLDHLEAKTFYWYASYLKDHGLTELSRIAPLSFFCDSWEVDPTNLGYKGIFEDFIRKFGYDLTPFIHEIDAHPAVRFDYRSLIADRILSDFYEPYADFCSQEGALSRVQCHGAPTDILAAYALCDIPETETLLFNPDFALIAASAAAFFDKPIVSSESFSCIYGWVPTPQTPPGLLYESVEDLKCLAASQFAWGINRVVWHGKPFSTPELPRTFYASVHVGPDGALAPHFKDFNAELTQMSETMSRGKTVSRLAVYLPIEDQWMRDELPENLKKPSSNWYWELQELSMDQQLLPYRPLWFSPRWLDSLRFKNGSLYLGDRNIGALYCDCRWMTYASLSRLAHFVRIGAPVIFNRWPKEPGQVVHEDYLKVLGVIQRGAYTTLDDIKPLITSPVPIDFWCRRDGTNLHLLFSHPQVRNLRYPMQQGFADSIKPLTLAITIHAEERDIPLTLEFADGSYAVTVEIVV